MRSVSYLGFGGVLVLAMVAASSAVGASAEAFVDAPQPSVTAPVSGKTETAVFAGGCFWGVEGVFDHVKGVASATSGYAGGRAGAATYEEVSTGTTGHAEAVRVIFDPARVSYADLLRVYFSVVADPTTLNAQGPDHGSQYRTALFPQSAAQERVARAYLQQLTASHIFSRPIVTRIEHADHFYPAEGYHQNFMAKNPTYPYIVINDAPKVDALRRMMPRLYRS
ncbi:peptide-methionine (S)-S-oxide reductase MsrA [Sphingomonas quercus]|uniref:Peptide methionine sulfoxide reductase MsrA n=1 Tax=Sphingomonas quercus TaxID=2842451 RepID=A0ABS6BEH8_9SPHN|nr:peptide-methionine (S)-S-oxide reductase MsrA [Sphingomonas quercus]MBU3076242.1 peptide-methionine (S)-S-oxide reductase MsrA [Sphingomonas quercus]